MLEYAAHASETWTAKELRETFERSASERDTNPQEELDRLLQTGAPADADAFWEEVERNLDANRLRLLFISDRIPDELARVATFLNEQMPDIEVLAVEIKRFQGETNQTLVPRVIGRTTRGAKAARGRAGSRLTRESFLDGFADEGVRAVASDLLDVAQQGGARIAYGQSFGLSIRVPCEGIPQPISVAWLYTKKDAGWMRTREFTFGVVLYEHELPPEKLAHVEGYLRELREAAFTRDVSSKGVQAWAVGHEAAVEHREYLTALLERIISLAAWETSEARSWETWCAEEPEKHGRIRKSTERGNISTPN